MLISQDTNGRKKIKESARGVRGAAVRGVPLHQDKSPVLKSTGAMAPIQECGFELVLQLPYSPDLAPMDYYLCLYEGGDLMMSLLL